MVGARKLELLRDGARQCAPMTSTSPTWRSSGATRRASSRPGAGSWRPHRERRRHARHRRADLGGPQSPSELSECQLHESLINLAFAAADEFRLICPYDTAALPEDVIAEARRSHPVVSLDGTEDVSHDYCGIDRVAARFAEPLAEPPADAEELTVTLQALRDARRPVCEPAPRMPGSASAPTTSCSP